jgi:hypothetical protein
MGTQIYRRLWCIHFNKKHHELMDLLDL